MPKTTSFQSRRLMLRPFEPEDVLALRDCLNHPDLEGRRYVPWVFPEDIPLSCKQVEEILVRWGKFEKGFHLALVLRESGELIGHASCEWEWDPHCPFVTVVIAPPRQRQGFGTEALQLLVQYLFENTPAHNVSGWMADWNQAALRFAEKFGFRESGRSRREGLRIGAYFDGVLVDLLRPEWQAIQGGQRGA